MLVLYLLLKQSYFHADLRNVFLKLSKKIEEHLSGILSFFIFFIVSILKFAA
jgi:hypothetical protein